jgi:hypothetical protein
VVFRGLEIGVFDSWYVLAMSLWPALSHSLLRAKCSLAVSGVKGNSYHGYSSETEAEKAFAEAEARGETFVIS